MKPLTTLVKRLTRSPTRSKGSEKQAKFHTSGLQLLCWRFNRLIYLNDWSESREYFADFEKTMSGVNAVLKPTQRIRQLTDLAWALTLDAVFERKKSQRTPSKCLRKTAWMRRKFLKGGGGRDVEPCFRYWCATFNRSRTLRRRQCFRFDYRLKTLTRLSILSLERQTFQNSVLKITPLHSHRVEELHESDWGFVQRFQHRNRAISPLFQSGSDAWTSMKTMLLRLVSKLDRLRLPQCKTSVDDERLKEPVFFDATWRWSQCQIFHQLLHDALKDLSDEQRNSALNTIFGTDAMRAAAWMANFTKKEQLMTNYNQQSKTLTPLIMQGSEWTTAQFFRTTIGERLTIFFISIGQLLAPAVKSQQLERSSLRVLLLQLFKRFESMPQPVQDFAKILRATTTAVIVIAGAAAFYRSHFRALRRVWWDTCCDKRRGFFASCGYRWRFVFTLSSPTNEFPLNSWHNDSSLHRNSNAIQWVSAEWLPIITAAMQNIRLAIQYVRKSNPNGSKPIVDLLVSFIRDNWETIAA